MVTRAWTHWATSRDLSSLRLPAHDAGTGLDGVALGDAQFGGPFVFDVFDAYAHGLVTNPNMVVAGAIGAGKSTVVKMQLDRALEKGRRAVVLDPKGEYGSLALAHGVTPVVLGRDGWCDPFAATGTAAAQLLRALVASSLGRTLGVEEHYVLDDLWRAAAARRPRRLLRFGLEYLHRALDDEHDSPRRRVALGLHRLVDGDLAGLFDGDDEPIVFDGSLVVVDLSAQWASDTLAQALLSVVAAAHHILGRGDGPGYLVLDEAWALLRDESSLRWLQGSWKLARARGVAHVLVLHRFSDVAAVGDAGSAHVERARGLLRESETLFLLRQPPDEANEIAAALGLSERERRYLEQLPRGTALVRFGAHRSVVRLRPSAREREFLDTDAGMRLR